MAVKNIERLRGNIDKQDVREELLAHRSAITDLHTKLGSFQKAAEDRPGLVTDLDTKERKARDILRDLGREPDLDHAEGLRIKRTQRQKIQSLAGDCKALLNAKQATDQSLRNLRDYIDEVESALKNTAEPMDPIELKRVVRLVQKRGDLDQQLDEARSLVRTRKNDAEVDLKKLRLWNGTLDEVECLRVPMMETVERFEDDLTKAQSEVGSVEQRIDEMTGQIQRLDQQIETLRLEQDVPTEDDLSQARQQRDDGWRLVLRAWRGGTADDDAEPADFIAQFATGGDLAQAFQSSVEAADQVSDRLRREADRVAEKVSHWAAAKGHMLPRGVECCPLGLLQLGAPAPSSRNSVHPYIILPN